MENHNQYTKSDGGRMWGGDLPTKFSVVLTPDEADQLGKAARMMGLSKSDLIRQMIAFAHKRADAILERYPDLTGSHLGQFEKLLWDLDNPHFVKWQRSMAELREKLRPGQA